MKAKDLISDAAAGIAVGLLIAFPVMWCWNFTMPVLFDLPAITWAQAWCLRFVTYALLKRMNNKTTVNIKGITNGEL